jgi:hypothetical protein
LRKEITTRNKKPGFITSKETGRGITGTLIANIQKYG